MWQKRRNNLHEYKNNINNNISYFDGTKPIYNLGSGDSYYIPSFIDRQKSDSIFQSLINGNEVKWYQTYLLTKDNSIVTQKRLSNTQISPTSNNNNIPLYRYPSNNLQSMPIINYTKSVQHVVECVENQISQPLNHAVVQVYRNGKDHIGYHFDKMLDIKTRSQFAAISFGTKREFAFKEIDGDREVHIIAHHGSLVVIGPKTNKYFKHSVLRDGTINTPRISISVRYIDTFWNSLNNNISGQGSQYQSLNYPIKPFERHDLTHKIKLINYKYNIRLNPSFVLQHHSSSYKYNINNDKVLMNYKTMEICYTRKDSHFRCMLFENIYNKSQGYELLKYLHKQKYPQCIHIPYSMIINDNIFEYNDDGEPIKAQIGKYLLNILKKNKNKNVMIVVIRHWLGTLLGLRNLANCYQIVSKSLFEKLKNIQNDINNDDQKQQNNNDDIKVSTICSLKNLKSMISMNGKLVRIIGPYNEYEQRYPVFVYETKEVVLIKPSNLEIIQQNISPQTIKNKSNK